MLWSMGIYDTLEAKEGGNNFAYAMFEEMLPISAEKNGIPQILIKLDQKRGKKVATGDSHNPEVIKIWKQKVEQSVVSSV